MSCKKIKVGQFACAVAMGLVAMSPSAVRAQDTMTMTTTGTTGTTMSMSQPTLVTGTVLRYYVDRSGYVTAMDVQTADGVQFVRFSPGMGQRLYTTYPVGGQASVYVQGTPYMGGNRWDVVSVGNTMPAPGTMMQPYTVTDAELLDTQPYIMAGAKMVTVRGRLKNLVVNDMGEVVGLVIKGDGGSMMPMVATTTMGTTGTPMTSASTESSTSTTGDAVSTTTTTTTTTTETTVIPPVTTTMAAAMVPAEGILVRVPRELRHIAPGHAGTNRVTPLFRNAEVEVTGYPEAPRFGVISLYENRIAANAIVVNGRAVGAVGIPMMSAEQTRAIFNNVDIGGTSRTAEEMRASGMGYTVYGTSSTMGTEPAMTTDTMSGGTTTAR